MELPKEDIDSELKFYEDVICESEVYKGTPEGNNRRADAIVIKGCLTRLGLLSDSDNHQIWKKALSRAHKTGRNYDRS